MKRVLVIAAIPLLLLACNNVLAPTSDEEDELDACSLLPKEEVFFPVEIGRVWKYHYHSEQDQWASGTMGIQIDGVLTWTITSSTCAPDPVRFKMEETFDGTKRVFNGLTWNEHPESWSRTFNGSYEGRELHLDTYTAELPQVYWNYPMTFPDTSKTDVGPVRCGFGGCESYSIWLVRGEGVYAWSGGRSGRGGAWKRIDLMQE